MQQQQLQGQSGGNGEGAGGQEQKQQREGKKNNDPPEKIADLKETAEARASILSQILEPDAADRLGRIRLVKVSRAEDVENRLIMLARSGQLRQKISEAQLKDILGAMAEQQEKKETVKVERRKGGWDDDDLEDLLNDD
jgi:programmed cell death protein 5